jgi:lipoprotein-anchoring transpeptidase ErfK/SrfK
MIARWWGLTFLSLALFSQETAASPHPKRLPPHRRARPAPAKFDATAVNDPATRPSVAPGSAGSGVLRAEILLSRAHFSCGEIDGHYGQNLRAAIRAFQESRGLPQRGGVDDGTWDALNAETAPALVTVAIAPDDVAGPFTPIPDDMLEKAKLPRLGYSSPLEAIAEKYHSSPKLLEKLNPNAAFDQAGTEILVPNAATDSPGKAAKVVVSKSLHTVEALDDDGQILASYPASIGSEHDPLPLGQWKILGVARDPVFHYNPDLFWDARENEKAAVPPGPNNPVGVCWIDLSKPHYGIHGTAEPSQIGRTQSHGCIRLTNWDASELSQMVKPGTPAVLTD